MTSRLVELRIQWRRQGNSLGTSSEKTVYLWWPIVFLALVWNRALNVVVHELGHQVQAIWKDPLMDEGGHHPSTCECIMMRGEDQQFWGELIWKHAMVSNQTARSFVWRSRVLLDSP